MGPNGLRRAYVTIAIVVIVVLLGAILVTYLACHGSSNVVGCVRDVAIIALVLETMVVTLLLLAMTILLTGLVQLIQDRLLPVLESSLRTMKTVEGTTTFVSDTIAAPIIGLASVGASLRGTLAALLLRRRRQSKQDAERQEQEGNKEGV
jgi:hypothetical protein